MDSISVQKVAFIKKKKRARSGAPLGPIPFNLFKTKMSKQFTAPRARLSIRRIAFIKQKIDNLSDNSNDFSEKFIDDRFFEWFFFFDFFHFSGKKWFFWLFFRFFWKFTTFFEKNIFFAYFLLFLEISEKSWLFVD